MQQKFQHPDGRGFAAEPGSDEAVRLAGLGFAPVDAYETPEARAERLETERLAADHETRDTEHEVKPDGGTDGNEQSADTTPKARRRSGRK